MSNEGPDRTYSQVLSDQVSFSEEGMANDQAVFCIWKQFLHYLESNGELSEMEAWGTDQRRSSASSISTFGSTSSEDNDEEEDQEDESGGGRRRRGGGGSV